MDQQLTVTDGVRVTGVVEAARAYCRRRIKTEEKAKVVNSVWGEEFIQFLAVLAILPRTILKNRMNSSYSC